MLAIQLLTSILIPRTHGFPDKKFFGKRKKVEKFGKFRENFKISSTDSPK